MSAPSMALQVVPEMSDDDSVKKNDESDVPANNVPGTTEEAPMTKLSVFELQLRKAQIECDTVQTPTVILQHQPRLQPLIRRVSCDAQPLTPMEVIAHRHLLPP